MTDRKQQIANARQEPTDPRNSMGQALFDQAAADARSLAQKILDAREAEHREELAEQREQIIFEFRDELRASRSWQNDITGEATVGREQRIIKAYLSGDILELGAILNEGLNFEFDGVVSRRLKAKQDDVGPTHQSEYGI